MDHAALANLMRKLSDDLVTRCGLPRSAAELVACRAEIEAECAAVCAKDTELFLREYREFGPVALSEAVGCHRDTLRRKYNAANAEKSPKHFGT